MNDPKHAAVNNALGFPTMEKFEADLVNLMNQPDAEGSSSIIIALTDCDKFMRVNTEFGRECAFPCKSQWLQ